MIKSSTLVLLFRVFVLLLAGALAVAGFVLTSRGDSAPRVAAERYECPMHPEVSAHEPGQCPICKMELESTRPVQHAPPQAAAYSCPMHPEVSAKEPGRCPKCGMALRPIPPPAPKPSASIPEGERPQTPPAQQHAVIPAVSTSYGLLWLPETFPPAQAGKPGDRPAIAEVKKRTFVDDVRAPAWLESEGRLAAVLYKDELIGLWSDDRGTFFRALTPRIAIDVRLSDEPPTPWDASTSLVRFVVEPDATEPLRAGEVGWLVLPAKYRELLAFPESALLRSSEGPYVLVPGADQHTFDRRRVQIGRILKGQVVVLSGLHEGDRIVVGNAFFLDGERQQEEARESFAGVGP
jgi:hypothetical protein